MNKRIINRLPVLMTFLSALFFLTACPKPEVSRTTGWELGDPATGEYGRSAIRYQDPGPGMVYIEGGSFLMGRTEEDVMFDWNNLPRRVTVASFFMDETEITNFEYREYLHWLSRVFRDTHPEVYRKALPDTLVWRDPLAYNEPFVENYLRHPAFDDYPVVGVSWVQASDYARWRTDRVNEWILVQNGYLDGQRSNQQFTTQAYLAGVYDDLITGDIQQRVRWEDGLLLPRYRLPTEAEWEFAALGLIGQTVDENIDNRRIYPWNGSNVRSMERRSRGEFIANFQRGPGDLSGIAGSGRASGDLTMPVYSFWPNDYGLYNMAGNVSEWVKDVYRPLSHETVADFRPYRGNIFQVIARDDEGKIIFDEKGNIQYEEVVDEDNDNNQVIARDSDGNIIFDEEGNIQYEEVEDEDEGEGERENNDNNQQEFRNYRQGNFIDYRDGDPMSAINEGHLVYAEGYTLISNEARVYKGGSWRDRVYWLSPGTRRFLDQNKATNDIGFRCAMDQIGRRPK